MRARFYHRATNANYYTGTAKNTNKSSLRSLFLSIEKPGRLQYEIVGPSHN